MRPDELERRFQARLDALGPSAVSLAPGVRSDGQVLGRSPAATAGIASLGRLTAGIVLNRRSHQTRRTDRLGRTTAVAALFRKAFLEATDELGAALAALRE